jgi:hypothetical protein
VNMYPISQIVTSIGNVICKARSETFQRCLGWKLIETPDVVVRGALTPSRRTAQSLQTNWAFQTRQGVENSWTTPGLAERSELED